MHRSRLSRGERVNRPGKRIKTFLFFLFTVSLKHSDDRKTYYLKIHAPWEVLATYAEVLKIKVPFKKTDIPKGREISLAWLTQPIRLPRNIMKPEPDYFTAPFNKNKVDFFLIEDTATFFPPSTRNRIVSFKSLNVGAHFITVSVIVFLYRSFRSIIFLHDVHTTRRIKKIEKRLELRDSWITAPTHLPTRSMM